MPSPTTVKSASTATSKRPGLGTLVLTGFALGIFCGLFFGEMATVLNNVGRAYVRLLQMAIVPYITVSLIAGLGRLTPQQASRIAIWGGAVLLLLLGSGTLLMLLVPLAYPDWEAASYFSSSLLSTREDVDFVSLYISANPFDSLANTVVPAVVLFSLVMGVAVMMSEKKAPLLEIMASLEEALMNITRFMVNLAPVGIFAIAANAAGKLDLSQFDKLQVYVWAYLVLWALMFFVLLPGLLCALTPIRYREIFSSFRVSFITAFVTGSVLVVLPMMISEIRTLLQAHGAADEESDAAVDVLIPTTFNFPSVAMLLALSFVLFSGWYSGSPLDLGQYPLFASVGLFVSFGGTNIALPFLLDLFRLPADMFDLFLVANVITNFFFMALSAMSLVVMTLLAVFLIKRRITPKPILLAMLFAVTVAGAPALLKGTGLLIERMTKYEYSGYEDFVSRRLTHFKVDSRSAEYQANLPIPGSGTKRLQHIKSSGWLRVGHAPDALPWAFRNAAAETVGFDMALLNRLAADLGVGIEILRVEDAQVPHALASGQIDIFASGMLIDPDRVQELHYSIPYGDVTLGLLVEDHRRREFESRELLADGLSVAVLQSPALVRLLKQRRPDIDLVQVPSPREFLRGKLEGVDAVIMSVEAASAWTLIYPQFSAVIPGTRHTTLPLVFGLPLNDPVYNSYIDNWIRATRALGTMDAAYNRWILGRDSAEREPRWSIIRDVLHWVD